MLKKLVRSVLPRTVLHRRTLSREPVEPELRFLLSSGRGGLFIDVGANVGVWSHHAAGSFPEVHCFEPDAELAGRLPKVLPQNVTVHAVALSDHEGSARLGTPVLDGRPTVSRASLEANANGGAPETSQTVALRRLDDYGFHNVGAIKIDVEGHEAAVLEGAWETIEREKPLLVVEIEERHHPGRSEALIQRIVARGYVAHYWKDGLRPFQPGTINELQKNLPLRVGIKAPDYINNFIFMPEAWPR